MFNFLINKSYRNIENYRRIVNTIKAFDSSFIHYSDIELQQQTSKLKEKLRNGKSLDNILPEAFATAKEATKRILGLTMFDVQLLGGIVLHRGKIAEMKTGEGKTIVAILPAYLNALTQKSVHIITVNDYLAKRDAESAGQVHQFLGLTVGLIQQTMSAINRKEKYNCDITYVTNSELGFDYLRDNMAIDTYDIVQRPFNFGIIDEVDSILIDEARTPLIISGPSEASTDKYKTSTIIANQLIKEVHYEIDEKARNTTLTEAGISLCEELLNVENLYSIDNPWTQYILNSLKAKELFLIDRHYIVRNNEVIIVDEFTGRIMEGRRWSDGLHQAIESKENVEIQKENQTLASITYQNLFLLYKKLAGMTGTAKTEETELDKIYKLEVIEIPTNKPCRRKELSDLVYKNEYSKWEAITNECYDMYQIGKPTLVGTTNVEKSELLASMLEEYQIPYNLLNAKPENIARESEIIAQAGRKFAITISTNMAGRGTDIILGGNASAMAKLVLNGYIKQTFYSLNNYQQNAIDEDVKNILETLNNYPEIIKIWKNIDIEEVEKYLLNLTYAGKKLNDTDKKIQKIYSKILHIYSKIFHKEKEEIILLGGLHVIGTERHESRRIDNQLKGRAGRQGDPGSSRFFLSLQDNLLRIFGGEKISNLMQTLNIDENTPIESIILTKSLDSAQKKVESYFYDVRKQLFDYDEVINNQRQAIYAERKRILQSNFTRDCIIEYAESTIDEILYFHEKEKVIENKENIVKQISELLNLTQPINITNWQNMNHEQIRIFLYEQLRITYDLREGYLEQLRPGLIRQLEKYYLLQQIDKAWQEHLEKMTILRESIGWRSYGQQDPLVEYKNEAFNLFISMVTYIRQTVVYLTMRSRLIVNLKE
uniref:Protein translocase subunit SecA n=1 Tax=Ahnfeltia plicata TaxID=28023 RepID=A0A1C9CB23_9FLOR|nr:preprotein translocase subunit SecA [Ahnfeltia plicata]AOM65577.1 preprotein translocase subunit SecA [Ahnfeltia plicata]UAT97315.1 preprotein translocase subunit SecA [Ahnfeltia plicata]